MSQKKIVLQSKVLRDTDRIDRAGMKRSKGVGFVEFTEHADAATAMNALVNRPILKVFLYFIFN